jgi:uncharacterized protein YkwD
VAKILRRSAAKNIPLRGLGLTLSARPGARLKCMKLLMVFLLLFQNTKPQVGVADLEQKIHQLVNFERKVVERTALEWDDQLAKLAQAHSEDMAKRKYFKHVTPEGLTPMKRAEAAGYNTCQLMGENIYQNNLYSRVITEKKRTTYDWNSIDQIASTTVKNWMQSEGHRQNLLEKNYTKEGIGVAIDEADEGKVYITQVVCGTAVPTEAQTQR